MANYSEPYQYNEGDSRWIIDEIDEQGVVDASFAYPTEDAAREAYAQLMEASHAK